jgi:hypothetical protein
MMRSGGEEKKEARRSTVQSHQLEGPDQSNLSCTFASPSNVMMGRQERPARLPVHGPQQSFTYR